MEFWIGLSVGMHLGKIAVTHLQDLLEYSGYITPATHAVLCEIEKVEEEIIGGVIPKAKESRGATRYMIRTTR
jgi:hypothetical protein